MRKNFSLPRLIVVNGVPGSGKTTLSTGLSSGDLSGILNKIQAVYLNKDLINNAFTLSRADDKMYQSVRSNTYVVMDNLALANLKLGNSVLLEGTFRGQSDFIERYQELAKKGGAVLKIVRTVLPEKVLRERIAQRNYRRDFHKLNKWKDFLEKEPIRISLPSGSCEVDMNLDFVKNVERVVQYINER